MGEPLRRIHHQYRRHQYRRPRQSHRDRPLHGRRRRRRPRRLLPRMVRLPRPPRGGRTLGPQRRRRPPSRPRGVSTSDSEQSPLVPRRRRGRRLFFFLCLFVAGQDLRKRRRRHRSEVGYRAENAGRSVPVRRGGEGHGPPCHRSRDADDRSIVLVPDRPLVRSIDAGRLPTRSPPPMAQSAILHPRTSRIVLSPRGPSGVFADGGRRMARRREGGRGREGGVAAGLRGEIERKSSFSCRSRYGGGGGGTRAEVSRGVGGVNRETRSDDRTMVSVEKGVCRSRLGNGRNDECHCEL
mmetsp:Transcript_11988/g.26110  ORF Transcript_11988/g.26110 Transcript_11988/m.26110 type:complete len:296 (+) Transcript_11988:411-1298(+)